MITNHLSAVDLPIHSGLGGSLTIFGVCWVPKSLQNLLGAPRAVNPLDVITPAPPCLNSSKKFRTRMRRFGSAQLAMLAIDETTHSGGLEDRGARQDGVVPPIVATARLTSVDHRVRDDVEGHAEGIIGAVEGVPRKLRPIPTHRLDQCCARSRP